MSIGGVFKAIGHFFERLFGKQQIADFAKASEGMLASAVGQIALAAVAEVQAAYTSQTGQAKHDFAFSAILEKAKAQGLEVRTSIINLLIELALQKLKGTFGA